MLAIGVVSNIGDWIASRVVMVTLSSWRRLLSVRTLERLALRAIFAPSGFAAYG